MDDNNFNKGAWTDEEHNKYVEALKVYGTDWKSVQAFIGTRSKQQISVHHRHHILKTTGALPEPLLKRKNAEEDAATPKKARKSNATPSKSTGTTPKPKGTPKVVATKSATKPLPAKTTTTKQDKDILPPSKKITKSPANQAKESAKPQKVDPVANTSSVPLVEETLSGKSRVLEFLRRDEVLTVFAGVAGFLSVMVVKKLMG